MKKIALFIICLTILDFSYSQIPEALNARIKGKTNLKAIMAEVDEYYNDEAKNENTFKIKNGEEEEEFENDYLFWKRWEYYHKSRLDEYGNIVPNVQEKILEAINNEKAKATLKIFGSQSSNSSWAKFGPSTVTRFGSGYNSGMGRVSCLAFHPTVASTLLAGSPQGGIWKSTDYGSNWSVLSANFPSSAIGSLLYDRTNANIVYALTGDGDGNDPGLIVNYGYNVASKGVFKSLDGGVTWNTTGVFPNVFSNYYGYKLVQHPTNASILFAATTNGIYKTIDGGATWTQTKAGSFTDIEFKPGDATIMYAAQKQVIDPLNISTNSGDNWSNLNYTGGPGYAERTAIGVSANKPNYIYLLTGGATGAGSFKGVYLSTTAGTPNFTLTTNTPNILGYEINGSDAKDQAGYDLDIAVSPTNGSIIYTGGINIWKSTNAGSSFDSSRTHWYDSEPGNYVHADIHTLAYNPLNGYLYSSSDGGVGFTIDGTNWAFISDGLQIMATYHGDYYEANANVFVSGAQDNGTNIKTTASNNYKHFYGGDGFDCVIKDNDVNTIVFVGNENIGKTIDGGIHITNETVPNDTVFFPLLTRDYNSSTRIYCAGENSLARSDDFGTTWVTKISGSFGSVLTTCPSNSSRLYVASHSGGTLRRSDNATSTPMVVKTISGNPGYPTGSTITGLDVNKLNSLNAFACFGGYQAGKKVYATQDTGANWINISGSLPNVACHSIAVDANNTIYVGTDIGVFVKATTMSDWQPFYNNLPLTPVSDLKVNTTAGKIIAATFGSGNFISDLYSTCIPSLNLNANYGGQHFFEASNDIAATATIIGDIGAKFLMKAGDHITLSPGFIANKNSTVLAYINPCNTGGIPLVKLNMKDSIFGTNKLNVPAKNGIRFADAKISTIFSDKNYGLLEVISEGNYSAIITDTEGNVIVRVFTNEAKKIGITSINWNRNLLKSGRYYIQLFKEKELVHFQEIEIK